VIDISAVITAHNEGVLAGPSVRSLELAAKVAANAGLSVELITVLDKPDDVTRLYFEKLAESGKHRLVLSSAGDLGLARNAGIEAAKGRYVAFLDADDLWGSNWLLNAYHMCNNAKKTVAHCELNVFFGNSRTFWYHIDSDDADFDPDALRVHNYWAALAFAERNVFLQYPYARKDFKKGFGYEDWHWNCLTLSAGISHRPVPGTVHFIRKRSRSLLSQCTTNDVLPMPHPMMTYILSRGDRVGALGSR